MWNLENSPFIKWKSYLDTKLDAQFQDFFRESCSKTWDIKWLQENGNTYSDISSIEDSVVKVLSHTEETASSYDFKKTFIKDNNYLLNVTAEFISQIKKEKSIKEGNFDLYIIELEEQVNKLIAHPKTKFKFLAQLFLNYKNAILAFKSEPEAINSFDITPVGGFGKAEYLKKIYKGMTHPIKIIDCDEHDFIAAFINGQVEKKIKWLIKAKNGATSIVSIFFFLDSMSNKGLIDVDLFSMESNIDTNKKIGYIFIKANGSAITGLRKARHNYINRSSAKPYNKSENQIEETLKNLEK